MINVADQALNLLKKDKMEFESTHRLPFEMAEWNPLPGLLSANEFVRFKVGTCSGLWTSTDLTYDILAITNDNPGNGHFSDVLEWFENSCKRDKKALRILEVWNDGLAKHLVTKRGFTYQSKDNLIKRFK